MEKLPFFIHGNLNHRSGGSEQCGSETAVTLGADLKVYLHREPIDFRPGINSLAVLVPEEMELDPFAPAVFAFCNRRLDRLKLLFFDRSGFVMS